MPRPGTRGPNRSTMSSRTFVDTLDLPTDMATVSVGRWNFSCGLRMVDASIRDTPDDYYVTRGPDIMRLAHTRHHDGLDTDYVKPSRGESHDPIVTLYFQSRDGVLLDAWCSCGFNPNA